MPAKTRNKKQNGRTPCRLAFEDWPVCYADGCYLNNRCPVYRGLNPSPVRDYIPWPPVFALLGPFEAVPISYQIPRCEPDFDQ